MTYKEFWQLIDDARETEAGLPEVILIEKLRQYPKQSIIDFEYMLREFLAQLHHRRILKVFKTRFPEFSDDCYLYFRCWIIWKGNVFMEQLLEDASVVDLSDPSCQFELLLYAADAAFEQNGFVEDLPRDLGSRYLDYDGDAIPLKGEKFQ